MRKLCIIQDIIETKSPNYLYKTLENQFMSPRSFGMNKLQPIFCDTKIYKLSFFPSTIRNWNKLDDDIRVIKSKSIFKKRLLNKIRPKKASYFGIRDHDHIRYLTMLRMELSPLRDHKFRHGFLDTSNNACLACKVKEDTEHFLLFCKSYSLSRTILMQNISNILELDVSSLPRRLMVNILLFGKEGIPDIKNNLILNHVIKYIVKSKRLDIYGEGGGVLI